MHEALSTNCFNRRHARTVSGRMTSRQEEMMLSMPTKFREPRALLMMADTRPNTTGPAIMIQSHQLKRATLPGSNMSVSLTSMSLGGGMGGGR